MNNLTYTKKDLAIIVRVLQDTVDDLENWSTTNEDKYSAEIESLQIVLNQVEGLKDEK